jgi:hypothetical protein
MTEVELSQRIAPSAAARILSVSTQHLRRLAEGGALNPVMTDLGRLFDRGEVERLAAERASR